MPSFTTSPDQRFPAGTTLYCYPAVGLIPSGEAVDWSVVASNSTCTFDGLEYYTRYLAGESPEGPFVAFRTQELPGSDSGSSADTTVLVGFVIWDEDAEAWMYEDSPTGARPEFDGRLFWLGGGSTQDPTPAGLGYATQGDVWLPSEVID
jgi:hypothetical protein